MTVRFGLLDGKVIIYQQMRQQMLNLSTRRRDVSSMEYYMRLMERSFFTT